MKLRGPVFFPLQFVVAVADAAQIAGERVILDVNDVLGIVRPGQTPLHRFAADRNVAKAGFDEALAFVAAEGGSNESRLALIELQKLFLESGELEEVIFLGNDLGWTATDRAIDGIGRITDVKIVITAVATLLEAFVDVSGITGAQQEAAHRAQVFERSSANEMGIADPQFVPEITENSGIAVHVLARADSCLGRRTGDIFAVLIGASEKGHVVALHALEAGNRIGNQGGVSRANVRPRVRIVDRRGEIELRAIV